ncbi:MAG: hypothetical protein Q8K63_15000 [Acidimicrobiales bacterium]|nr:hypothetical protein [Acidimicrobiales bacterium]
MTRNLLLTLHISAVAAWLGADLVQYVVVPRLRSAGRDAEMAWSEAVAFLHARYYAIVAVVILFSGIALVVEGDWPLRDSRFIWVGVAAILLGGGLGGGRLGPLAKKRLEALQANNADAVAAVDRQAKPIEIFLSLTVVVTILAMVSKWGL